MCLHTLDEEPSLQESPVPSYRFVCGTADGEGGGVARFCHLQARAEIIVKSQLPIPDGQTQELTLGEAGWTFSRGPGCGTEPICPLALVGAGPTALVTVIGDLSSNSSPVLGLRDSTASWKCSLQHCLPQ